MGKPRMGKPRQWESVTTYARGGAWGGTKHSHQLGVGVALRATPKPSWWGCFAPPQAPPVRVSRYVPY